MPLVHIRRATNGDAAIVRVEDTESPGYETIATFSASDVQAAAIKDDPALRLSIMKLFQGPYVDGLRPKGTLPSLGDERLDDVVPAIIDAAIAAREEYWKKKKT